jgi:hypothetical protein
MKGTVVVLAGVVCPALAFLSCDVGVTVASDGGGGQGEPGKDSGGHEPGEDGGQKDSGAADGGKPCPAGSHEATCHTDADCPENNVCVVLTPGREECGTECRDTSDCPDYGAPNGQYCLKDADCPRGEVCGYFDPHRPECGGGCVPVEPTDGGMPDAGPSECKDLDFCGCFKRPDCQVLSNGCLCPCDYHCPGEPECVCGCGGGEYLGCADIAEGPCGADGFCRLLEASSCGDPDFAAAPELACKYGDGGTGYCCVPIKKCARDADCPGCEVCEMTQSGEAFCVEPAVGADRCEKDGDCRTYYRCDPQIFKQKPECGGICVYDDRPDGGSADVGPGCSNACDCAPGEICNGGLCTDPGGIVGVVFCCEYPCPSGAPCEYSNGTYGRCAGDADVGWPDAGACLGEGEQYNRTGDPNPPPCCPGLEALPALAVMDGGGCAAPACDCIVCTKTCGNGVCSAGKNACNCPQDCPATYPGAPGSKCTSEKDCSGGAVCLIEGYGYPKGGYCFGPTCDPNEEPSICPAGSVCLGLPFSQALGHCMPSCRSDADCRPDLTCEWMPSYKGTAYGAYTCWQGGSGINLGAALGDACSTEQDCISWFCEIEPPNGGKVCSAPCDAETPCKKEQTCVPYGGCSGPQCGACF